MAHARRPRKLRSTAFTPVTVAALILAGVGGSVGVALPHKPESNSGGAQAALAEPQTVQLIVPQRAVARGESFDSVPFVVVQWPKQQLEEPMARTQPEVRGKVALAALSAMNPVPRTAVGSEVYDPNAVVERIPEGMRAITVKVDAESAVEGWAQPGNFIDVLLLRQGATPADGMEAKVIAENVQILSAGRSAEQSASAASSRTPSTVTLLVRQEEALKVKTAASIGKLTFALRGDGDQQPTTARTLSQRQLLDGPARQLPAQEAYRGIATGPDGKKYVLGTGNQWIQAANEAVEEKRAKLAEPSNGNEGE